MIAKHYQELRPIMKDAKHYLEQHTEYVKHCILSEESDGIRSRTSSELSSECVKVEESAKDSESYSSADETDDIDEGSDTRLVSKFCKFNYMTYIGNRSRGNGPS